MSVRERPRAPVNVRERPRAPVSVVNVRQRPRASASTPTNAIAVVLDTRAAVIILFIKFYYVLSFLVFGVVGAVLEVLCCKPCKFCIESKLDFVSLVFVSNQCVSIDFVIVIQIGEIWRERSPFFKSGGP